MNVKELNRKQLIILKGRYLSKDEDVSYGELLEADNLVSDETIFEEFEGINFVEEDF